MSLDEEATREADDTLLPPAFTAHSALGRSLSIAREFGVVAVFVSLFVVLSMSSGAFLTQRNLLAVLDQWAPVGIMACGGTFVIIAGGFDLSIGAIFTVSAIVGAKVAGVTSAEVGYLAGIGSGLALGIANGAIITIGRVNDFIATIATGLAYSGLALLLTNGLLINVTTPGFDTLGSVHVLSATLSVYIFATIAVLSALVLNRTTVGRHIFATGGNREAARLSGVRVGLTKASTYALSGLAGGIAGIIVASRSSTASATIGTDIAYSVWAGMLVGGNSVAGGEGAIWRTVVGVLLLALIDDGLNLLGINPLYGQIITGAVILGAVALDRSARLTSR